jgi:hypothetical protein
MDGERLKRIQNSEVRSQNTIQEMEENDELRVKNYEWLVSNHTAELQANNS